MATNNSFQPHRPPGPLAPPSAYGNRRNTAYRCWKCEKDKQECTFNGEALHNGDWEVFGLSGTRCDRCLERFTNAKPRTVLINHEPGNFHFFCGCFPPELAPKEGTRPYPVPQLHPVGCSSDGYHTHQVRHRSSVDNFAPHLFDRRVDQPAPPITHIATAAAASALGPLEAESFGTTPAPDTGFQWQDFLESESGMDLDDQYLDTETLIDGVINPGNPSPPANQGQSFGAQMQQDGLPEIWQVQSEQSRQHSIFTSSPNFNTSSFPPGGALSTSHYHSSEHREGDIALPSQPDGGGVTHGPPRGEGSTSPAQPKTKKPVTKKRTLAGLGVQASTGSRSNTPSSSTSTQQGGPSKRRPRLSQINLRTRQTKRQTTVTRNAGTNYQQKTISKGSKSIQRNVPLRAKKIPPKASEFDLLLSSIKGLGRAIVGLRAQYRHSGELESELGGTHLRLIQFLTSVATSSKEVVNGQMAYLDDRARGKELICGACSDIIQSGAEVQRQLSRIRGKGTDDTTESSNSMQGTSNRPGSGESSKESNGGITSTGNSHTGYQTTRRSSRLSAQTSSTPLHRLERTFVDADRVKSYCNPDAPPDESGNTVLHLVVWHGMENRLVEMIGRKGKWNKSKHLEKRNHFGDTPLSLAAETNRCGFVRHLLNAGALVDGILSGIKTTALYQAVKYNHYQIAEELITCEDGNADPHIPDKHDGMSPYQFAQRFGNNEMKHLFGIETGSAYGKGHGNDSEKTSKPSDGRKK